MQTILDYHLSGDLVSKTNATVSHGGAGKDVRIDQGTVVQGYNSRDKFPKKALSHKSFYSSGKERRGQRPVINLKFLNTIVRIEHFQMEGLPILPDLIQAGDLEDEPLICQMLEDLCLVVNQKKSFVNPTTENETPRIQAMLLNIYFKPKKFRKIQQLA